MLTINDVTGFLAGSFTTSGNITGDSKLREIAEKEKENVTAQLSRAVCSVIRNCTGSQLPEQRNNSQFS